MDFIRQISEFVPVNLQEAQDKKAILGLIDRFPMDILLRTNEIAHITSSGFVMNESLDKVLLIHHNIRNAWAWTGGHVDGDADFLHVAIKEAKEETGIGAAIPLTSEIISLDVLPVYGHIKKDRYISAHLHLSVSFVLIASEQEKLKINEAENSGVSWFSLDKFTKEYFDDNDVYLYNKLIQKARKFSYNINIGRDKNEKF